MLFQRKPTHLKLRQPDLVYYILKLMKINYFHPTFGEYYILFLLFKAFYLKK